MATTLRPPGILGRRPKTDVGARLASPSNVLGRSRLRDPEVGRAVVTTALDEIRCALLEQAQDELCAAYPLAAELHCELLEMEAGGVDVRRVAQPELHVHRCGEPDD